MLAVVIEAGGKILAVKRCDGKSPKASLLQAEDFCFAIPCCLDPCFRRTSCLGRGFLDVPIRTEPGEWSESKYLKLSNFKFLTGVLHTTGCIQTLDYESQSGSHLLSSHSSPSIIP